MIDINIQLTKEKQTTIPQIKEKLFKNGVKISKMKNKQKNYNIIKTKCRKFSQSVFHLLFNV